MKSSYIKIPVEMAQFAMKQRVVTQVRVYLTGLLIWSGKVRYQENPVEVIASYCQVSTSTVNRSLRWLKSRNWIGKDRENGWYFFRGLNRIHEMEGWQYSRAVILHDKDLQKAKEFFISTVVSSAIKTGRKRGGGTEPTRSCSKPARFPVPVSYLEKTLSVSRRTAISYFKIAKNAGYIDVLPNFERVFNLSPADVNHLKVHEIESVEVQLIGSHNFKYKPVNHLRIDRGKVYLQGVNLIRSHLLMGNRRLN